MIILPRFLNKFIEIILNNKIFLKNNLTFINTFFIFNYCYCSYLYFISIHLGFKMTKCISSRELVEPLNSSNSISSSVLAINSKNPPERTEIIF